MLYQWTIAKIRMRYEFSLPSFSPCILKLFDAIQQVGGKLVWKEIYAFDDTTSRLIKSIPEASSLSSSPSISAYKELPADTKSPCLSSSSSIQVQSNKSFSSPTGTLSGKDIILSVYTYPLYQYYRQHHVKFQLLMLGLSLLKVGEYFALWWLSGSPLLSLATAIPWMYFFFVAVIVEVDDLNKTRIPQDHDSHVDMLSGQLPRMTHAGAGGSTRKIILGASQITRNTAWWKIMWGMGALVCLPNTVFTYIVLSYESNYILSIWVSFQVLWTFVRIIVHHFAEPMNNSVERIVAERSWSTLPSPLKYRVVKLMSALASYLTSVHPRREIAYRTAAIAPEELRIIIFDSAPSLYYPLPQNIDSSAVRKKKLIGIHINAVIGDPTLSSAAWIAGARHLTPTDLYDCCIISFRICNLKVDALPQAITIPCARVLSGFPVIKSSKFWSQLEVDEEVSRLPGPRQFVPKHSGNTGGNWCYFIPCDPGLRLWLYFKKNMTENVVGEYMAEALTDIQVTAMLAEGDMNISLSHVDEMKQIVDLSEQARRILLQILVP